MIRRSISDTLWQAIKHLLPGRAGRPGARAHNNRLFLNAVFWILRTGAPWRDLPTEFGKWASAYTRFRRWAKQGLWQRIFSAIKQHCSDGMVYLDSTIVRAHQHAAGAKGGGPQALGRSRGGLGTKIHAAVDTHGTVMALRFTGGEAADVVEAPTCLRDCALPAGSMVVADRAYDSDALITQLHTYGIATTILARRNRLHPRDWDRVLYRTRNIIERFFARIKQHRRVATRYDKMHTLYASFWFLAAMFLYARVREQMS